MSNDSFNLQFHLEPILHSKYYGSIPQVADIEPSLDISEIVKTLNKVAHDISLKHLKRVSNGDGKQSRVIVGKIDSITSEDVDRCRQLGLKKFETVSVPSTQPWTRIQFNESKAIWPVNFHEEKFIRQCLDGSRFGIEDLSNINYFMAKAFRKSEELKKDVAIVVDGNTELQIGVCQSINHPLRHCCVNAVDLIAASQTNDVAQDIKYSENPYLCTNFDLFVTREPCLMCSMALLHSRIKRLFFLDANTPVTHGCPMDGSFRVMKLHVNPKLNHRFEVWKMKIDRRELETEKDQRE